MLEQELVQQGMDLLLFGMGTVFVFLSLLVLSTNLMSACINRFFPEPEKAIPVPRKPINKSKEQINPDVLSAIQLAINEHRAKQ